ncbi:PH domain-containing protein [Plantactinospora veratri]
MRPLPATYGMPRAMVGYFVLLTVFVMLPVGYAVLGTGLPGWLSAVILLGTLGLLLGVSLRVSRMGTVVDRDGILRRGFLGDRRYGWSDIRDFHLHDNRGSPGSARSTSPPATWWRSTTTSTSGGAGRCSSSTSGPSPVRAGSSRSSRRSSSSGSSVAGRPGPPADRAPGDGDRQSVCGPAGRLA